MTEPYLLASIEDEVNKLGLHDNGNARRFAIHHCNRLRFVAGWGWLRYGNGVWHRLDEISVQEYGKQTARDLLSACAANVAQGKDSVLWQQLARHAFNSNQEGRIRRMIELARSDPDLQRQAQDFDLSPVLLNVRNGVVDLSTGHLEPHHLEDNMTRQVPVDYNPGASCPTWLRFIEQATRGDKKLADYLRRAAGYTLTGHSKEQVLFFLFGEGRNGKSTFLETLRGVMGTYGRNVPTGFLMADRYHNRELTLSGLHLTRMVTLPEAGEDRRFDESFLKSATGEDTMTARAHYTASYDYKPSFKLWVHGNSKPTVKGTDLGIWRRFHIIPFLYTVPEDQCDPHLQDKLKAEAEGILAWMVEGARLWYRDGLLPPLCMKEALGQYRKDSDVLGLFIEEECIQEQGAEERASDLVRKLNNWCAENGYPSFSTQKLGARLSSRGYTKRFVAGKVTMWEGLALKP